MTLEFSLRQRARRARCYAVVWLGIAVVILVGAYVSLPSVAAKTLESIHKIECSAGASVKKPNDEPSGAGQSGGHLYVFALTTLVIELSAVSIACYLLGKSAYVEVELAARLNGIADALCLSGDDFGKFEKSVALLVPKNSLFAVPEFSSKKELQELAELVKKFRA